MGMFKSYDIRGIYGSELTEDFAYKLGKAISQYTKAKKIVIGYDSRVSNLKLFSAMVQGVIEMGVDVMHIGLISKPMLNWVAINYKYDLGILISASHNPKEYNGFKFIWKGKPLYYEDGLNDVEQLMNKGIKYRKAKKHGKIISKDYIDEYVKFLSSHLSKDFRKYYKKFVVRIVADASNGAAGEIIRRLLKSSGIEYRLLFADPDGTFPCHNPNPLDDNALVVLSKNVREFKADFGFIVDPDADRIRFVDEKGQIVDNNYVDCLVVKYLLKKHPHAFIVHDITARKILSETIIKNGGRNIASKVGTSNIIQNMAENNAIFGCEMSGHRYFRSMHNLDSGLMMLIYFINTFYCHPDHAEHDFSRLWKKLDKYIDLEELNYKFNDDNKKHEVLARVLEYYKKNRKKLKIKHLYNIDGVSVITSHHWFNIRPSNTEPLLRLRIEGKNEKDLLKVKRQIEKLLK